MTEKSALELLRQSIDAERVAVLERHELYRALTAKMLAFQVADGPAPTVEEFEAWRSAIEEAVQIRKQGGS